MFPVFVDFWEIENDDPDWPLQAEKENAFPAT